VTRSRERRARRALWTRRGAGSPAACATLRSPTAMMPAAGWAWVKLLLSSRIGLSHMARRRFSLLPLAGSFDNRSGGTG
jgi:hypothetical protein